MSKFDFASLTDSEILKRVEEAKVIQNVPWFGAGTYRANCTGVDCWKTGKGLQMVGWTFKITQASSTAFELDKTGKETDRVIAADAVGASRSYKVAINDPDPKSSGVRNLIEMLAVSYGCSIPEAKEAATEIMGVVQVLSFCQGLSPVDLKRYQEEDAENISDPMKRYKFAAEQKYVQLCETAKEIWQQFVDNVVGVEFEVIGFLRQKKIASQGSYVVYRWARVTPIEEVSE